MYYYQEKLTVTFSEQGMINFNNHPHSKNINYCKTKNHNEYTIKLEDLRLIFNKKKDWGPFSTVFMEYHNNKNSLFLKIVDSVWDLLGLSILMCLIPLFSMKLELLTPDANVNFFFTMVGFASFLALFTYAISKYKNSSLLYAESKTKLEGNYV